MARHGGPWSAMGSHGQPKASNGWPSAKPWPSMLAVCFHHASSQPHRSTRNSKSKATRGAVKFREFSREELLHVTDGETLADSSFA